MISLTPVASTKVKEIMQMQSPVPVALRVAVVGGGCSGFQYHMAFENQTNDSDELLDFNGLKVAVDQMSSMYLEGVEIDYIETVEGAGFKFNNPNVKSTCGCGSSFNVKLLTVGGSWLRLRISGLLDTLFRSLFYGSQRVRVERQIQGSGRRTAGRTCRFRSRPAAAVAAWSGTGLGLRYRTPRVAAGLAPPAGYRGGFLGCCAGDSRAARTRRPLRGAGGEAAAWDSTLASRSRGSESTGAGIFAGRLRELPAALAFFSDRTHTGSGWRAVV